MTDDNKHFVFNEGLPTRPDVDLLLATWPSPKVGDTFAYSAIESLLRISFAEARFRTVTTRWRQRMHELGYVIECKPGDHFFVASADQISSATHGVLKFVGRKAHKHRKKLAVAKIETDLQRSTIEHQARLMLALEKDAKKARMNLLPGTASPERPKIEPPKKQA